MSESSLPQPQFSREPKKPQSIDTFACELSELAGRYDGLRLTWYEPKPAQSRRMSLVESIANVLIGYLVAVAAQLAIFPLFEIHVALSSNLAIAAFFTVVSLVRSYALRRLFNAIRA